ncbi:hypothetical protein LOS09_03160 [Proteus mirabilis]|uniref:hypothetical protein n=1 Tax=Proteus mirabilis TaxID=584 RepID=UPI001E3F6CF6|nr:hypothetical protein [Proteus mirabilis]MCD4635033.1 hypothetical protein [Proteus mirabilis]
MRKVTLTVSLLILFMPSAKAIVVEKSEVSWMDDIPEVRALGCKEFTKLTYSKIKPREVIISESIFSTHKLMPNSYLECSIWKNRDDTAYVIKPKEHFNIEGHNIGVYHEDGSGRIDGSNGLWSFGCKSDAMTDEYYCYLSANNITVTKDTDGYQVYVGNGVLKSSRSLIRFDKDKPIESELGGIYYGEKATDIIKRLNHHPKVTIRYYPYRNNKSVDEIININNFNIAKSVLDKIYDSHK